MTIGTPAKISDMADDAREHVESADCWCGPEVEYVPARGHDLDCEKDLHGWSICSCPERAVETMTQVGNVRDSCAKKDPKGHYLICEIPEIP